MNRGKDKRKKEFEKEQCMLFNKKRIPGKNKLFREPTSTRDLCWGPLDEMLNIIIDLAEGLSIQTELKGLRPKREVN